MIEANLYLKVLMVTLAFYAIMEHLSSSDMQQILEVNIATSWMFSKIKKSEHLVIFSESRHDFRKFLPVKQVIKKCDLM